jgi:arginine deiminase
LIPLVEKAVAENTELKTLLIERGNEIQRLNQQLSQMQNENPQVIEQQLTQLMMKLKTDFALMYKNQSTFFMEKIDLLKQEQRDSIATLYKR